VAGFGGVLVPLLTGFVGQVLIGSLAYLLPMVLGGVPARVRARQAVLDRHWSQRVVMGNTALAVLLLPVGSYVRITTSLLVLAALVQFLVAAVRAVMVDRRS
jgi:nitrite reductase (NO-forming)